MKKSIRHAIVSCVLSSSIVHAADFVLYPAGITSTAGSTSTVSVDALKLLDQNNYLNDWNKYIEFYPATTYAGTFSFTLPSTVDVSKIISYKLNFNYLGQSKDFQLWSLKLKNQTTGVFTTLGTTTSAIGWKWTPMSFTLAGGKDYVSAAKILNVQYSSNNNYDVSDVDFVSLTVTTQEVVAPAPTPTPGPTPTPTTGTWYKPAVGTKWAIQFSGMPVVNINEAQVYDLDLYDTPQSTIDNIHAQGKKVICYMSAGSFEDWRTDAATFPSSVLGNNLDGWVGEKWLDVRQLTILQPIMAKRMDLAKAKKCDGIDIDNVDGYTNSSGFPLTYQDQINYNKMLANEAHARGMGIGLKNDLLQVVDLVDTFDWQINEQCFQYNECHYLVPFIQKGKPVFNIEYNKTASVFCPTANKMKFSSVKKKLNLNGWVDSCSNYPTAP